MKVSLDDGLLAKALEGIINFFNEYQILINAGIVFVLITLIIIFIINVTKLSTATDNPMKRQEALHGILITGVCIAILSSLWIIFGLIIFFVAA